MPVSHHTTTALAHFWTEKGFKEGLQCKSNASSYQSLSHTATGIWICFAASGDFTERDPDLSSC